MSTAVIDKPTDLRMVEDDDFVPAEHERLICIMDRTGDSKHIWDKNNEVEVAAARTMFSTFRKKGYAAYSVKGKEGAKGEVITEFDPDAERIIFAPPMVGG